MILLHVEMFFFDRLETFPYLLRNCDRECSWVKWNGRNLKFKFLNILIPCCDTFPKEYLIVHSAIVWWKLPYYWVCYVVFLQFNGFFFILCMCLKVAAWKRILIENLRAFFVEEQLIICIVLFSTMLTSE